MVLRRKVVRGPVMLAVQIHLHHTSKHASRQLLQDSRTVVMSGPESAVNACDRIVCSKLLPCKKASSSCPTRRPVPNKNFAVANSFRSTTCTEHGLSQHVDGMVVAIVSFFESNAHHDSIQETGRHQLRVSLKCSRREFRKGLLTFRIIVSKYSELACPRKRGEQTRSQPHGLWQLCRLSHQHSVHKAFTMLFSSPNEAD